MQQADNEPIADTALPAVNEFQKPSSSIRGIVLFGGFVVWGSEFRCLRV